jgi:hypothetical protein
MSNGRNDSKPPIDVVYTWVDDTLPGYREQLLRYARSKHDTNPNRTRDNLQLLRYSLRSLACFAPWVRRIYLLTQRPQVPAWLDRNVARLRLVHHDEIMDASVLPTFNSFAIISHLHLIPELSPRFLYFEDDMSLGAPIQRADLEDDEHRIRVYERFQYTRAAGTARADDSPWNAALARTNSLLDRRFGARRRHTVNHLPLFVDQRIWGDMLDEWPDVLHATRASRFRAPNNFAPEYLYPHYLLATGQGVAEPYRATYRTSLYLPLENNMPLTLALIALAQATKPKFITMNDNFGDRPSTAVVARVRSFLQAYYPIASPFERDSPE